MTVNARTLEHAIAKMLSHPLDEVREIGAQVKITALAEVPTLVKYANPLPYLTDTCAVLSHRVHAEQNANSNNNTLEKSDWCQLIDFDRRFSLRAAVLGGVKIASRRLPCGFGTRPAR